MTNGNGLDFAGAGDLTFAAKFTATGSSSYRPLEVQSACSSLTNIRDVAQHEFPSTLVCWSRRNLGIITALVRCLCLV
jgi:hypothetical protein